MTTGSTVKHSMGGQAFAKDAVVLDMTGFNQMSLDKTNKVLTVQSGAIWHDIQNFLNPQGLAVKSMQSVDIFTVGGTLSVNAHGMDHHVGSISSTVRSLRLMDANGNIKTLSRTENPTLFNAVIGGYGLFGVILDAQLDVVDNVMYQEKRQAINYNNFPQIYQNIASNNNIGLAFAHFSLAPQSFFKDMIVYSYDTIQNFHDTIPPLKGRSQTQVKLKRLGLYAMKKTGALGREVKWLLEKYFEPTFSNCYKSRSQAMGEPEECLISRNEQEHDSNKFLENNQQNDTDIIQEYFIPRGKFVEFVDGVREILLRNKTNIINSSVRIVNKENVMLNYAPEDMFALVMFMNQNTTPDANQKMEKVTKELIDWTTKNGGTFYLPYQLHYTKDELRGSYPNIDSFFALKKQYDPSEILVNKFYLKYGSE